MRLVDSLINVKAALKTPAVKMCHVVPHDGWTCNGVHPSFESRGREGDHGHPAMHQLNKAQPERVHPGPRPCHDGPSWAGTTVRLDPSGRPLDGGRHYCRGAVTALRRALTAVLLLAPWARSYCGTEERRRRYCRGDAAARILTRTDAGSRPFLERFSHTQKEVSRRHKRFVDSIPHRSSPISFLNSSP